MNKKNTIFLVGVIVVFVVLVGSLLVFSLSNENDKAEINQSEGVDQNEELSFDEDVYRFLYVYFTQEFRQVEDRALFVKLEAKRFFKMEVADIEKDKKELLLVNLTKVLDKIENNQYDFEAEDLELKNLLDSLNLD